LAYEVGRNPAQRKCKLGTFHCVCTPCATRLRPRWAQRALSGRAVDDTHHLLHCGRAWVGEVQPATAASHASSRQEKGSVVHCLVSLEFAGKARGDGAARLRYFRNRTSHIEIVLVGTMARNSARRAAPCRLGIPRVKGIATATAVQGAFGTDIFKAARNPALVFFPRSCAAGYGLILNSEAG
jgi:hypothetical protein